MILRDASDGGDFHPSSFPIIRKTDIDRLSSMDYAARATFVYAGYFTSIDRLDILKALTSASAEFDDNDPVPVVKMDDGLFLAELCHGKSLGSSDVAASTASALIHGALTISGDDRRVLIVTTDADTALSLSAYRDDVDVLAIAHRELSPLKKRRLLSADGIKVVEFDGSRKTADEIIEKNLSSAYREKIGSDRLILNFFGKSLVETVPYVSVVASAYCDLVASEEIELGDKVNIFLPAGDNRLLRGALFAKKAGLPIGVIAVGDKSSDKSDDVLYYDADNNEKLEEIEEFYDDFDYVLDPRSASASVAYFKYLGETQDYTPAIIFTVATPYDEPVEPCRAIIGEHVSDAAVASKKLRDFTGVDIPETFNGLWSKKTCRGACAEENDLIDVILNLYGDKSNGHD